MTWTVEQFLGDDFVRARRGPPPQAGKMTEKKLAALIKGGFGQGHFHRYKTWLRVTKRDHSPNSHMGHLPAADLARLHHPRSIAERRTMLIAKWLGAADVRDAFPMWPWPHEHPGVGLEGFENTPKQSGLLSVAQQIGIDHGTYPGTHIPYVGTVDVMTTWRKPSGGYRLLAFDNKPEDVVRTPNPCLRSKERLELARRYCQEADLQHVIIHAERLPIEFCANLDALQPDLSPRQQAALLVSPIYLAAIDALNVRGFDRCPNEVLDDLRDRHGYDDAELTLAFHTALWRQDVDHDLSQPLRPWEPLRPGGRAFKQALAVAWRVAE